MDMKGTPFFIPSAFVIASADGELIFSGIQVVEIQCIGCGVNPFVVTWLHFIAEKMAASPVAECRHF